LKYLLEAFPIVRKKIPTARLIVVGKGWFGRIKDLTARGIYFEGHISPYDIPKYYASCDLFCSPATGRESFGIILLEAMSSGKPVVASNIPGYKEVIKDGEDGLLVEPENPSLLAQAIIKVLTNKELSQKLSASGRKKALKYSWSIVTKRIEEFYLKRLRNKDLTSSKYIIQKNDER
jgi:phosphatidylinositol alpha-mannosyltransferase